MKKGLGKGLGALFEAEGASWNENIPARGALELSVNTLEPRADQPRKRFEESALAELSESIKLHGILQPLAVREAKNGRYEIISGERRWRAAKLAGLKTVPVILLDFGDKQAREAALVENLQREDLNPVEEALGYQGLIGDYGLTQEEAAARVGKSRSVVANALRLLALPVSAKKMLESGILSSGHARALLPLKDAKQIEALAERIEREGLSVREVENEVKRILSPPKEKKSPVADIHIKALEDELSEAAGRRVVIRNGKKGGRIELEYYGREDLEALIGKIKNMR